MVQRIVLWLWIISSLIRYNIHFREMGPHQSLIYIHTVFVFKFGFVTSAHLTLTLNSHQPFSHRFYYVLCWRPSWMFWSRLYYSPSIGPSMEHSSQCGFQMVYSFQRRIIFRKKFPMNPVLNLSCGDSYLFVIFK